MKGKHMSEHDREETTYDQIQMNWLAQGSEAWNNWRAEEEAKQGGHFSSSFSGTYVSDLERLPPQDLTGLDLSRYNLAGVRFTYQNLNATRFTQANLAGTHFDHVRCCQSDFRGSDLTRADFWHASLKEADFRDALHFASASFYESDLSSANLSGLDLRPMKFTKLSTTPDLSHANLSNANMRGVVFESHLQLLLANLSHANLSETTIACKLKQVNWSGADLTNATVSGALTKVDVTGANLTGTSFHYTTLANMDLRGVDLSQATFEGTRFVFVQLSDENIEALLGINLQKTTFKQVDFSANLWLLLMALGETGASFVNCKYNDRIIDSGR
jgi:uncharacterized protein YjbI with pentapeptide repeats